MKYLHNIQGWRSGKVSFQDLAIHRVGVKLPFKTLQTKGTRTQLFRSYFSEEIFSWSLSEWLSAHVGVFSKRRNWQA